MTSDSSWWQVDGNAALAYEHQLVPAMFKPWAPLLVGLAEVSAGESIVDVACGTGVIARVAAASAGRGGRVVGLDFNPAMLGVARWLSEIEGADIEWLEASALAIPRPTADFDVVLCAQGLQQFSDRPTTLREMRRVLRNGGRLAASVWSQIECSPGMAALVTALERHVGMEAANNRRVPFG